MLRTFGFGFFIFLGGFFFRKSAHGGDLAGN